MRSESEFILHKVRELIELCTEQRNRGRCVNMEAFGNALDSWEIGWKKALAALQDLEQQNYLLLMTGDDGEISEIVITPPTYRCHNCRLLVSSRLDWEDHLPDCRRQQAKMRRLGLLV